MRNLADVLDVLFPITWAQVSREKIARRWRNGVGLETVIREPWLVKGFGECVDTLELGATLACTLFFLSYGYLFLPVGNMRDRV